MLGSDPWDSPSRLIRRAIIRVAILVGISTLGALASLTFLPGQERLTIYAYLLAIAAILLVALAEALARARPLLDDGIEKLLQPRQLEAKRPAELQRLSSLVLFSCSSAADLHFRLRPMLREIAAHRLAIHRSVDLDLQPEEARKVLGPAAWDLVRPDRPDPPDRHARGIEMAAIGNIVAALEEV